MPAKKTIFQHQPWSTTGLDCEIEHGDSLEEGVIHYFSCLEFKKRPAYFDHLRPTDTLGQREIDKLKRRIEDEEARIRNLRKRFEEDEMLREPTEAGKLLRSFKTTLTQLRSLRRAQQPIPPRSSSPSPHLVETPRPIQGAASSSSPPQTGPTSGAYIEMNGITSHSAKLETPKAIGNSPMPPSASSTSQRDRERAFILDDLNVNVIYFKKSPQDNHLFPYDHPDLQPDKFPNQKIPLRRLLEDNKDTNPLMWKCEEGMIRYFHLPANNMEWIEEAVARYYNEEKPDLHGPYRKPRERGESESKTRMLLRPQFWRGLQHGHRSDLPTHTRHMRPRCYPISTDHFSLETKPNNLVVFMPYLHWETDRRRARSAAILRKTSHARWATVDDVVVEATADNVEVKYERATSDGFVQTNTANKKRTRPTSSLHKVKHDTIQGQKLWGKLLFIAAALSEAMDAYSDEKLVEKYLTAQPPLHPRRTLDQSYYWTLKDTRKRDRDQVVYRATAPTPKLMHHKCFGLRDEKGKYAGPCLQCNEDSRKVPRVIMVDQLWLWLLDENTIITSFPKRWGRNKPDTSAVQKCIRTRLRAARDDEVGSIFDLALIIIDQCSRVFFDRTQSTDLQPQVMDNFANAIGKTHKQTIAFDHFWEYTHLTSRKYNSTEHPERAIKKMQEALLDINPEGELLREIKDILDELFIMTQIKTQERSVARTFVKHVRQRLRPTPFLAGNSSIYSGSEAVTIIDQYGRPRRLPSFSQQIRGRPSIQIDDYRPESEEYNLTTTGAEELLESIDNQLQELQYLKDAAENTSLALNALLALKQQQAGVLEAREAVKQGEEVLRQGRSIMMFTIVTIVFLPLSFFTGVFGMNAVNLTGSTGDGLWNWGDIFKFMVPISVVVITTSLLLAFSKVVRAMLSFAFNISWAWLITRTSAYVKWHGTELNSQKLKEREETVVNKMKVKALRDELDARIKKQERDDQEQAEKERSKDPTSVQGRMQRATRQKSRERQANGRILPV